MKAKPTKDQFTSAAFFYTSLAGATAKQVEKVHANLESAAGNFYFFNKKYDAVINPVNTSTINAKPANEAPKTPGFKK